jgi:hypothetical protein
MRLEVRVIGAVLCALPLLFGCAAQRADSRDTRWDDENPDRVEAAGEQATSEEERADVGCAREIRSEIERQCSDAPPTLPESYAARARGVWKQLEGRCPGMRSRAALREFDGCVVSLELTPNQIDVPTESRRAEARAKVGDLKADPLYVHARRRLREALEEATMAAQDYEQALQRGTASNVRFRAETWTQAEKDLREAEERLRELMVKHSIDPRDAHALGVP